MESAFLYHFSKVCLNIFLPSNTYFPKLSLLFRFYDQRFARISLQCLQHSSRTSVTAIIYGEEKLWSPLLSWFLQPSAISYCWVAFLSSASCSRKPSICVYPSGLEVKFHSLTKSAVYSERTRKGKSISLVENFTSSFVNVSQMYLAQTCFQTPYSLINSFQRFEEGLWRWRRYVPSKRW